MIELQDKRVLIMGLGRFGGGVGVARYCCEQGADVAVTDLLSKDQLKDSIEQLKNLPIQFRLGGHSIADFSAAQVVVINPAVDRRNNQYLRAARAAGAHLTSEIRMLLERLPNRNRIIGITGTTGKSTTAAMIGHILRVARATADQPCPTAHPTDQPDIDDTIIPKIDDTVTPAPEPGGAPDNEAAKETAQRPVHIGGNLGGSLLNELDKIESDHWVVLELSSFMLRDIADMNWSPHIAVVTNFAPNHLDMHHSLDAYANAKQVILKHQGPNDVALLGESVLNWKHISPAQAQVVMRPIPGPPPTFHLPIRQPGVHNQLNATMAVMAAEAAGVPRDAAIESLRSFQGLPHRLQLVAEHNGVVFVDDSKSTTPESTMLAIDSFRHDTAHVILGGSDKKADFQALAKIVAAQCPAAYTIGQTGNAIADAIEAANSSVDSPCIVHRCDDLQTAVTAAIENAGPGEIVLLSPGCASWDQFDNYEHRADCFVNHINQATQAED
jgi:UDP-N-acetylmuramoylalanine--D-glutamate ligase